MKKIEVMFLFLFLFLLICMCRATMRSARRNGVFGTSKLVPSAEPAVAHDPTTATRRPHTQDIR